MKVAVRKRTVSITISTDYATWFGALITVCSLFIQDQSEFQLQRSSKEKVKSSNNDAISTQVSLP